ncbi:MAG: hypothetical protein Q9160_007676 [Pyrenula sp. 1 TL-2023]
MPATEEDIAWFKSTFHAIPKARLPDDCVEYSIYLFSTGIDSRNGTESRRRLEDIQRQAALLQKRWLKDYIWQRQGFSLEIVNEDGAIIKPIHENRKFKSEDPPKLGVQEARQIVLNQSKRFMHSTLIEEEAFYRLRNYPSEIAKNMHHALMTLPRQIAFLLRQKPSYISPAIEAFYLRDPIALKPLQSKDAEKLNFKPDDLVEVSVKLPKVTYAQIRTQDFDPPPTWKGRMPTKANAQKHLRTEIGMKISCGFEMLITDNHYQDKPAVREIKMLLEDLQTGDEQLPSDEEIGKWSKQEDDEKWLEISMDDLEGELAGKRGKDSGETAGFGDRMAQENLQRIVAQFESMLNEDEAGSDGKGLFEDDSDVDEDSSEEQPSEGEDLDSSFDETRFNRMMREMMGMPADANVDDATIRNMVPGVVQELESDAEEENADDVQTLMSRMEAELNERGALDPTRAAGGKGKERATEPHRSDDSKDAKDHDIDNDFTRNLVQAFKRQTGSVGQRGK